MSDFRDSGASRPLFLSSAKMKSQILRPARAATLTIGSVVFVHGLTGNRDKTWTHSNGTFWPEVLAADLPQARIMTFGYDADVVRFWSIASSNRLDDHGKSLANAIL